MPAGLTVNGRVWGGVMRGGYFTGISGTGSFHNHFFYTIVILFAQFIWLCPGCDRGGDMDSSIGRDDIVLDIMPRMAFGTGTHESTQICLVFLETILLQSQTVLDLGTGSGILAIAAAKLGAARVLAVDIDEVCMANARENAAANHVNKVVEVRLGSLESTGSETFDLVMANINRNVIIPILPEMKQTLNKDGRIMLSGLLESEKLLIEKAVHDCGCEILNQKQIGEWIGFVTSQKLH